MSTEKTQNVRKKIFQNLVIIQIQDIKIIAKCKKSTKMYAVRSILNTSPLANAKQSSQALMMAVLKFLRVKKTIEEIEMERKMLASCP